MEFIEPFNLERIFIVDLAGSLEIFTFVFMIVFAYIMAKYNFSGNVTLILFVIFSVLTASYIGGIYALAITFSGIIIYWMFTKFVNR